jgi:glycosyltransferase involved in cell wall biosynthesis
MCRALGIQLVELITPRKGLGRYASCGWRTMRLLWRLRPDLVVATNPSLVLGWLLLTLRPFLRFRVVSDAHHAGVEALGDLPGLQKAIDFHNRSVDAVIVTNQGHADRLRALGARTTLVCQDPLPQLEEVPPPDPRPGERSAFLICSFDSDEPYQAVFAAFELLQQEGYTLYVSGDPVRAGVQPARYPWVHFLGFVPRRDYVAYLRSCAIVLDLTTLENCLVCGAYEALSLARPLVLSSTDALRDYFSPAAVFCGADPHSIAAAVRQAHAQREELTRTARRWAAENHESMDARLREVAHTLGIEPPAAGDPGQRA